MGFQRGAVRRITFEIEYPDGSRKERTFDGSDGIDVSEIRAIVLDDSFVREGDESSFNVSESAWQQNPTMGIYMAAPGGSEIRSAWTCTSGAPHC